MLIYGIKAPLNDEHIRSKLDVQNQMIGPIKPQPDAILMPTRERRCLSKHLSLIG